MSTLVSYFDEIRKRIPSASLQASLDHQHLFRAEKLVLEQEHIIRGKKILEIGPGHGIFSCLMALLGAEKVVGLEGRLDHREEFEACRTNEGISAEKMIFLHGNFLHAKDLFRAGDFDLLFCAGVFYHMDNHIDFLRQAHQLNFSHMILDTVVNGRPDSSPAVGWEWEETNEKWNAISHNGNSSALVGTPNRAALKMMLKATGWEVEHFFDYSQHPIDGALLSLQNGQQCTYVCRPQ